ncbi:hypothetical protein KFK09_020177 [Dendrobium nobile]|uniref:Uncharacterized protein n=1 Tax=Dendrobium nobile TaxID=94219 RepID=A0A8T3AT97_DENNO|nr:hypothetical protein KFK09_020177 [Dendrobium nobile]
MMGCRPANTHMDPKKKLGMEKVGIPLYKEISTFCRKVIYLSHTVQYRVAVSMSFTLSIIEASHMVYRTITMCSDLYVKLLNMRFENASQRKPDLRQTIDGRITAKLQRPFQFATRILGYLGKFKKAEEIIYLRASLIFDITMPPRRGIQENNQEQTIEELRREIQRLQDKLAAVKDDRGNTIERQSIMAFTTLIPFKTMANTVLTPYNDNQDKKPAGQQTEPLQLAVKTETTNSLFRISKLSSMGVPPMREVQHAGRIHTRTVIPNRPTYRMSPKNYEEQQRQVEELMPADLMDSRNEGLGPSGQRLVQGPSTTSHSNSGLPEIAGLSALSPVLNFSIQTGEEFALEFMRERFTSKKPSGSNTSADQGYNTNYMDLRGVLGISHTGSESGSEISMPAAVINHITKR